MKDYTTEQVQIEDALKNIDPLNYPKQEAALLELGNTVHMRLILFHPSSLV
jgi:hypothetical protein